LLTPTRMEIGQENEQMWRGVNFAHQAGVPPEFVLSDAGWTEEKIGQLKQSMEAVQPEPVPQQPLQGQNQQQLPATVVTQVSTK